MKLPATSVIAREKLIHYLLCKLPENDKSGFLGLAGYSLNDPERLERDIRNQILPLNAEFAERTEYGDKYRIDGELIGPNGRRLKIESIWMVETAPGVMKFVTFYQRNKYEIRAIYKNCSEIGYPPTQTSQR